MYAQNSYTKDVKRPLLLWYGGKWRLAPWIISHFPEHQVYVEPFCGAASVFMRKQPVRVEVLNDLNQRLINVFRVLRDPVMSEQLIRTLYLTPYAEHEHRDAVHMHDSPVEDARRFFVNSFQSFGGVGGTKRKASWSRPCKIPPRPQSTSWANLPYHLEACVTRLKHAHIESTEAHHVISRYDSPGTLFYIDPPYVSATRYHPGLYVHDLSHSDHVALVENIKDLKGFVVLSGYDTPIYHDMLTDWRCVKHWTTGSNNKPREECLWLSPNILLDSRPDA